MKSIIDFLISRCRTRCRCLGDLSHFRGAAVLIPCPYCKHALTVNDPRPGRFTTRCSGCQKRFVLIVPDDPTKRPMVATLKSELPRDETITEDATAPPPPTGETMVASPTTSRAAEMETVADGAGSRAPRTASASEETAVLTNHGDRTQPMETVANASAAAKRLIAPAGEDVPTSLGGYQIEQILGRGGMGAVYLARQLSLDRHVALKTMRPEWARNPTFVARFVREAYAAAQLTHHNVVQIYDFGEDKGTSYFSMEFVPGKSLNDLLRQAGKLDPEVAVGYILQAARGLKFAHERGMIHRDVKPDNLMLSDLGIVKVADLGLVKTPAAVAAELAAEPSPAGAPKGAPSSQSRISEIASTDVTSAEVAMGTPAYMAPEQGRDAASVDARADIYSLGCTLYTLVTGRPPFEGSSPLEVITKHQTQQITPPDLVVKRVPKELSAVILKMAAKNPDDRYPNLDAVIKDLENYLGISTTGPFTPKEEHALVLETAVQEYNANPLAKLRPKLILGFLGGCLVLTLLCFLIRMPLVAGGFLGLLLLASASYFVIAGIARKTYVFQKARQFAFGSKLGDWLTVMAGVILILILLYVFKLFWVWVAFCVAAILLAFGFYQMVDRKLDDSRRESLERVEEMLKKMRLNGLEEDALRQFVCKYSGRQWEEFYEDLFGYEAKMTARDQWGRSERSRSRPKFSAWRDPLVRWIDAKQRARQEAAEKKTLQSIEEKSLVAQGVNLVTARRQSQRSASAMVTRATELRTLNTATAQSATLSPEEVKQRSVKSLLDVAGKAEKYLADMEKGLEPRYRTGLLDVILGPRVRFLAGALLLAGCVLWINQNKLISAKEIENLASTAVKTKDASEAADAAAAKTKKVQERARDAKPLDLPPIPKAVTNLFRDFNPGVAGLLLIVSAFFGGWRLTLFVVPSAAIIVLGRSLGIPGYEPYIPAEWSSLALGGAITVVGILYSRGR
jgi:eukaryotic-like serine/threonine-protein kinase